MVENAVPSSTVEASPRRTPATVNAIDAAAEPPLVSATSSRCVEAVKVAGSEPTKCSSAAGITALAVARANAKGDRSRRSWGTPRQRHRPEGS